MQLKQWKEPPGIPICRFALLPKTPKKCSFRSSTTGLDWMISRESLTHLSRQRKREWALGWQCHAPLWRRTMGNCGPRKIQQEERDSICVCPDPIYELPHQFADIPIAASLTPTS